MTFRTGASWVLEEKVEWDLGVCQQEGVGDAENYSSIEEHRDEVKALFEHERVLGWMTEVTDEDAHCSRFTSSRWRSSWSLHVVHDGSNHVHVKHGICPRDQVRSPGAVELRTLLRELHPAGAQGFCMVGDVSKAHRRIKLGA